MTCDTARDRIIGWIRFISARIAGLDRNDTPKHLENSLSAPKTTTPKNYRLISILHGNNYILKNI
jgi:hypothetical protein